MHKYLRFFDKSGTAMNLAYDEATDSWSGKVYLPKVSAGLYENQHVFVVEQVLEGSPPTDAYSFPLLDDTGVAGVAQWRARWTDDADKDRIMLYTVTESGGRPYISVAEQVLVDVPATAWALSSPGDQRMVAAVVDSAALQLNVALTSDDEGIYERTLVIEDMSGADAALVATIYFYGETESENEGSRIMLENLGRQFNQADAMITRNYDVKEGMPDWRVINDKRRELFVAGEEIYPYIGSYRGLINAVRFFGYQDLRIKEYWLNVERTSANYGKMQMYEVQDVMDDGSSPVLRHPMLPSTTYRKTSWFGLFYDITRTTGDVDQFGIPVTENAFLFTNEEVLLKLFALKEKLKNEYLPLNARIVDITGEGIYFERYGVRSWTDPLRSWTVDVSERMDFAAEPAFGYVRDLRRFQVKPYSPGLDLPENRFTNEVNPYTSGQAYPPYAVPGLVESIEAFYAETRSFVFPYTGEKSHYQGDEPGILAGCPVVLRARINNFLWDELDVTWDALYSAATADPYASYTWDNIDFADYYEIEWEIEKNDGLPYHFKVSGRIPDYYVLPHFLPYSGKYTVTLRFRDTFNAYSTEVKRSYIEVLDREVEIGAFCRFRNYESYTWDVVQNDSWDLLGGSTWHFQIEGESPFSSAMNEKLTNWPRYRNQDDTLVLNEDTGLYEELLASANPAAAYCGTRNLMWRNMDIGWDEVFHHAWDMYTFNGDFLGGFRIFDPEIGDAIQVGDYAPFYFYDTSPTNGVLDLQEATDQLNASTNAGLRKFTFQLRFQPNASPTLAFIHACAKGPGPEGWEYISSYPTIGSAMQVDKYSWLEPTWLDWTFDDFVSRYPAVDPELTFLDAPFEDLASGAVAARSYWVDRGYLKTVPLDVDHPTEQSRRTGHLPSAYGAGSYNTYNVRLHTTDFEVPVGVPVFFHCSHSEIPGRTGWVWSLYRETTGERIIQIKDKPFMIYTFMTDGIFTVETQLTDSNGNSAGARRRGFVKVVKRENFRILSETELLRR